MKVNSAGKISSHQRFSATGNNHINLSSDQHYRRTNREKERDPSPGFLHGSLKLGSSPPPSDDGDDGIAAMREQVLSDLHKTANKMKDAIFKEGLEEGDVPPYVSPKRPPASEVAEGEASRPWNLRTRRAACRTNLAKNSGGGVSIGGGNDGDGKSLRVDVPRPNSIHIRGAATAEKSPLPRTGGDGGIGEKNERPKFSVGLSKREIEEDFVNGFGTRLPRRPKKRPRNVQKQLDTLFPGLWLTEVTADMYKVTEPVP